MFAQHSYKLNMASVNPVRWFGNGLTLLYPFLHS